MPKKLLFNNVASVSGDDGVEEGLIGHWVGLDYIPGQLFLKDRTGITGNMPLETGVEVNVSKGGISGQKSPIIQTSCTLKEGFTIVFKAYCETSGRLYCMSSNTSDGIRWNTPIDLINTTPAVTLFSRSFSSSFPQITLPLGVNEVGISFQLMDDLENYKIVYIVNKKAHMFTGDATVLSASYEKTIMTSLFGTAYYSANSKNYVQYSKIYNKAYDEVEILKLWKD